MITCSSEPPANEQCYRELMPDEVEQCPRCLRVFCYNCIQQHGCTKDDDRPLAWFVLILMLSLFAWWLIGVAR